VHWLSLDSFPLLNSCLNATSASLLLGGVIFIKTGRYKAHVATMIAAFCTSTIFLTCYIIYHVQRAPKILGLPMSTFTVVYFIILFTHTILAIVIVPLILITFWRAYKRLWDKHRKIAVITMPLWFYVSVTGVVIYLMLYHHK
jgi:uncharacterized membrane protein YozB (DUF420 family)